MRTGARSRVRVVAAGVVGNMLEWYDFSIYGYFAVAIGKNFFHQEDPVSQVLATFGVFAVGFIMRPLGSIAFGYIGDRMGRSTALMASIVAMVVPTVLIGFLPGYQTLGPMAPVLLTVLRMLQGLAVGGEASIASVFLVEYAPPGRQGLVGAIGGIGTGLGFHLGSGVAVLCAATLSTEALESWGWRIPFLLGLVVGLVGFYLRRDLTDPLKASPKDDSVPFVKMLRDHWFLIIRLAGLILFNAIGSQLVFLYIVSWLQTVDGIAPARALEINTISMVATTPVSLLAGWLCDWISRRALLLVATGIGIVGALPFFALMHNPDTSLILLGQFGFVIAIGIAFGVMPAFSVEVTPPEVRCTALAIGANISWSLFGGLTPLVATWLVYRTENDLSPALLIIAAAALAFVSVLSFRPIRAQKPVPA